MRLDVRGGFAFRNHRLGKIGDACHRHFAFGDIAVVFEDQKLTYKELNEKANSLAYYLRFVKKVNRNDFVGIMVNKK